MKFKLCAFLFSSSARTAVRGMLYSHSDYSSLNYLSFVVVVVVVNIGNGINVFTLLFQKAALLDSHR